MKDMVVFVRMYMLLCSVVSIMKMLNCL